MEKRQRRRLFLLCTCSEADGDSADSHAGRLPLQQRRRHQDGRAGLNGQGQASCQLLQEDAKSRRLPFREAGVSEGRDNTDHKTPGARCISVGRGEAGVTCFHSASACHVPTTRLPDHTIREMEGSGGHAGGVEGLWLESVKVWPGAWMKS